MSAHACSALRIWLVWCFRLGRLTPALVHIVFFPSVQDFRVVVRIDSWETTSVYPNGHFVRVLGRIGDLEGEIATILVENSINVVPFSEAQVRFPWHLWSRDIDMYFFLLLLLFHLEERKIVCVCVWRPKINSGVIPQKPLIFLLFWARVSLLWFISLAGLVGERASGVCLSLLPRLWDHKCVPQFCFLCVQWWSNLGLHTCKHFTKWANSRPK